MMKKRKLDENDGVLVTNGGGTIGPTRLTQQDVREIIERFSNDQLLDILQEAVLRHPDVLECVRSAADSDITFLYQDRSEEPKSRVKAKAGKGSDTLSWVLLNSRVKPDVCRRYAGALFADACLKGFNGVPDVVECSFVHQTLSGGSVRSRGTLRLLKTKA